MEKSESIKNLTKALIEFQKDMKPLELDAEVEVRPERGNAYKFKYSTLANIIESTRELLAQNSLVIVQTVGEGGAVTTLLVHESGEWIQDTVLIAPVKSSPQALGSSITYAKRYSMAAILRLVAETDEDGNVAEGNEVQVKPIKVHTREDDPRPWLKEEEYKRAIKFLKSDDKNINVKGQGDMNPEQFVEWILGTYKMKRIYSEAIDYELKLKQNGSTKPVEEPADK
jgi:hypothetical protein